MDGYPASFLAHNVPFIVAAGISSRKLEDPAPQDGSEHQGLLLQSDYPLVDEVPAETLEKHFSHLDALGASWTAVTRQEPYRLRIKTAGRFKSLRLPPRRAQLPDSAEAPPASPVLHSPFSPLSSNCGLYPDGLIDDKWVRKHQEQIPAIYAGFYTVGDDKRLKADINNIKATLARSGYKTRVAVILLGQAGGVQTLPGEVQERLEGIRKGTALDPKSIFYIPAQDSPESLKARIDVILSALYSTAIEYYRDLGRHARKKRSRGLAPQPTIPPTTGTSQTLPLPGWNLRYDFKAAVFAEFRQEIDASMRSFEQAYEILLGQDVLDIIPSWSPRWNEARLLADVICIRCLRIHFWMGQTTLAVGRWQSHRDRIGDFVDRRGQGTNTYGWQAWESRWALVMAQLMEKAEVPGLGPLEATLFLQPERAVLGVRLKPWELLHHTGYWYRIAARHTAARRKLAGMIPDEDRTSPDSSPASLVARKASTYDTYLCPPPYREVPLVGEGVNHAQLIIDYLVAARTQFQARKQLRLAAEISLECAQEMSVVSAWEDVVAVLRPLWDDMSFRSEGWVEASENLGWLLRRAAVETVRADVVVAIDWALMHRRYSQPHQAWHGDLSKSLDGLLPSSKPKVELCDDSASTFITASFVFRNKEGKAGERSAGQIAICSEALAGSAPVTFSSIRVDFEGCLGPIIIENVAREDTTGGANPTTTVKTVTLKEEILTASEGNLPALLRGKADLDLKAGQRRVLEVDIPIRWSGQASASSLTVFYTSEAYDLSYKMKFRETDGVVGWYRDGLAKPRESRSEARVLHVQPRPPKMHIGVLEQLAQYYTNETVELRVMVRNDEDEPANVELDIGLIGEHAVGFRVPMQEGERIAELDEEEEEPEWRVSKIPLGVIGKEDSHELLLRIDAAEAPGMQDVLLRASYHLASDAAIRIVQKLRVPLTLVTPFEASYNLVPRVHPEPWPSLFADAGLWECREEGAAEEKEATARGLAQQWCLICRWASFAEEELCVFGLDVEMASPTERAACHVLDGPKVPEEGIVATPKTLSEVQFQLEVRKLQLDDNSPVPLDVTVVMQWRRKQASPDEPINTTKLLAGQWLVLGAEPRVLASVMWEKREPWPSLMYLDLTVENASHHLLTFGLTMEPSDKFAFSGANQTMMHVLPLSRRMTRYRLLPLVRGAYLRPGLSVRDKYFQKTLRIMPTEGMKIDRDGLLIWVGDDEVGEGEEVVEGDVVEDVVKDES